MLIREFYPGTTAATNRNDAFIELQMWTAGQNLTGGHHIDVYGPGGDTMAARYTFNPMVNPPNNDNQRTVLAGGSAVTPKDYPEDIGTSVDPSGGAICFVSEVFGQIDCVEWGAGNDTINAGNPVSPTAGITDTKSITRSIAPGCASLLEPGDDTNDSATDFAESTPSPRANSVAPTEGPCRTVTFSRVGNDTVTGSGINCPGDCSETYPNHADVSWTANPTAPDTFLSWTNCPSGPSTPVCAVGDLTSNLSITANFSGTAAPPVVPIGPSTPPAKKKCKKGQKLKKGKCVKRKPKKK